MASEKVGSIYYDLDLDDKKFNKGADAASNNIDKLKSKLKEAETGSFAMLGALTGLTVGIVAFGASSVQAFTESQDAIAQTNAVLKSTKGIAGVTGVMVDELASKFQNLTKFSDEEIRSAENMVLTFTNISKEVFPDTIETVLDMSQALGQDLKSSSIQLGKALQDPIQGVSALRRVGVNFSEAQQEMIKSMVDSGKTMEAQKYILQELKTEFGGSAIAAGDTFGGKLAILNNKLNDLQEEIGAVIVYAITPLIQSFSDWIDSLGGVETIIDNVTRTINENQDVIIILAGAIIGSLVPAIYSLTASFVAMMVPLLPFVIVGGAIALIIKLLADRFGGLGPLLDQVKLAFQGLWDQVGPVLTPILTELGRIISEVLWPAFQELWTVISTQLWPALQELWAIVGPILTEAFNEIAKVVAEQLWPALQELWKVIQEDLWPALQELWAIIEPVLMPILKVLAVVIGVIIIGAIKLFVEILKVVIEVIAAVIEWIANWIRDFKEKMDKGIAQFNQFRDEFGRGVEEVKKFIQGIIDKFNEIKDGITKALSNVFDAIKKPFEDAFNWLKGGIEDIVKKLGDLNPFQRHSPSLVDWITKGTARITDLYGNMFNDLNAMTAENRIVFNGSAQALGDTVDNAQDTIAQSPVNLYLQPSGLVARSRGELRDIAMDLIDAANEELKSRGLPMLGTSKILT